MMTAPTILAANPPKFDAAFLERRMREHREWQEQATTELACEVLVEVRDAIEYAAQLRTGYGPAQSQAKIARLR
jgi:hypothetical protein